MLNIEKYRDEILENGLHFAKKKSKLYRCNDTECTDCDFYAGEGESCRKNILDWLCSEYVEKPTLTEQEWHFCMAVQTGWIAKDKDVGLYLHDEKPKKMMQSGTEAVIFIVFHPICLSTSFAGKMQNLGRLKIC